MTRSSSLGKVGMQERSSNSEDLRLPVLPAAGGYPGLGGAVPNYPNGATYRLGFNYTLDPGTGVPAVQYWVDAGGGPQYAANATTGTYFDLGGAVGGPGDYLGGYFQIAPVQVPEPSMLALLGLGVLPLARRDA